MHVIFQRSGVRQSLSRVGLGSWVRACVRVLVCATKQSFIFCPFRRGSSTAEVVPDKTPAEGDQQVRLKKQPHKFHTHGTTGQTIPLVDEHSTDFTCWCIMVSGWCERVLSGVCERVYVAGV
jgi:hypothetical protein